MDTEIQSTGLSNLDTTVDTVTLANVITNINTVYDSLVEIMDEVDTNKKEVSNYWQGDDSDKVNENLENISQRIVKYKSDFENFIDNLKQNAKEYDQEEADVIAAISTY